jgi:hypothetical protein
MQFVVASDLEIGKNAAGHHESGLQGLLLAQDFGSDSYRVTGVFAPPTAYRDADQTPSRYGVGSHRGNW